MVQQSDNQPTWTAEHPTLCPRKGVRFNESRNQLFVIDSVVEFEEGIVEKLWYQDWERKEHKRAIQREAREWRKTGLGILLRDTFVNPNPKQTQSCLNAFTRLADNDYCRGIERYLSQQHDAQRHERKTHFIQDVVEQARYLQSLKDRNYLTDEEAREKLAEFSALQSKCAEVFARRIAKADETVVKQGEDPSGAAKLVNTLYRNETRRSRSMDTTIQHQAAKQYYKDVMPTVESKSTHRRSSFPFVSNNPFSKSSNSR